MDDKTTRKEGKTERKKKRVGNLDKRNYCVGTEPNEYIAKGRGSYPSSA